MTRLTDRIKHGFKRFWRRDDGIMAAEAVIVLPLFLFCTITMYSYWDAYRSLNSSQKASYTVSDMITRTMKEVSPSYIDGLRNTMQYMVGNDLPVTMRVSSVAWSGVRNRFEVQWSRSPNNSLPRLTTTTLLPLIGSIPTMADGDTVIIVETNTRFRPAFARTNFFALYLDPQDFKQFIVTRPRFVPAVALTN